jgi:hypothetical protein
MPVDLSEYKAQLRQVEALIECLALGVLISFIAGLAAGILLGSLFRWA